MCCPTTRPPWVLSSNGRPLPTMPATLSLQSSQTERYEDKIGAHVDLLAAFPYLGPPHNALSASRGASPCRAISFRPSQTELSRVWALHEGGRYERLRSAVHGEGHTTGGRTGMSRSSDGRLEVTLSRPGKQACTRTHQPGAALRGRWSACFESAMEFAARSMKITLPADHAGRRRGRFLVPKRRLQLGGSPLRESSGDGARDGAGLVEAAHLVCPYSRATHGKHRRRNGRWSEAAPNESKQVRSKSR